MKKGEKLPYHTLGIDDTLRGLGTNKKGLSKESAKDYLERFGKNELSEKKTISPFIVLFRQLNSFFVYILIFAALISYFVDHVVDVYVILAVIVINVSIGFFQEYKAERSIAALKKIIVQYAKVYRGDELMQIPAAEIVPGDIILIEEGDRIPADARLIELKNLSTSEASLTGESVPSNKSISIMKEGTPLADRRNMVWMGTFVATGAARAVVVATGDDTALGNIAQDISKIKTVKSHFQKKTDVLAMQMGLIALIGSVVIFIIGYFFRDFGFVDILIFTIASLIAAIPEGLPAVLIIVLAIGAFRMSKKKAIIRNLPSTETLAVVNTIITDKTGTLTQNTMTVQKIYLPGENEIIVDGRGWEPRGDFVQGKKSIVPLEKSNLRKLLHISGLCNNASLIKEEDEKTKEPHYKIIGDPTEASLLVLAEKAGLKRNVLSQTEKKVDDFPFSPNIKYRASLAFLTKEKKKQLYVIGAPENILANVSKIRRLNTIKKMTAADKNSIIKQINGLAGDSMRTIALAYKEMPLDTDKIPEDEINDLIYIGVVGIKDPPREGVKESLMKAKQAGIRVIMATGDHKHTAVAIAKEIGMDVSPKGKYPNVITGGELNDLNSKEFEGVVKNVNVFARLTPHMKLRIAETIQKAGNVIAMTGDGVNDAPALKKADIGIAMGVIGTDVARESAEIILADDNFATIVNAIEEGRIVFANTKQTSYFLITTNFAEQITLITTLIMGLPLPLSATQILWLNLVTDTGQGLGLASEPGHDDIYENGPENSKENILTKEVIPFMFLVSLGMVILTIGAFIYYLPMGIHKARTAAFLVMSLTQLYNSVNMRSLKKSVFEIGLFSNKWLNRLLIISVVMILIVLYVPFFQNAFKFDFISIGELLILTVISSSVFWLGEGYKKWKNRKVLKKKLVAKR